MKALCLPIKSLKAIGRRNGALGTFTKTHQVYEMEFYSDTFGQVCRSAKITYPGQEVAIQLIPGKGAKDLGLKAASEYYLIDNRLYKRVTWADLGKHRACGFKAQRDKCLIYFLVEVSISDGVAESIADAI